jgi:O-antigen ligase
MILINEEYLNNITRLFRKFYTVFSVVFIIALFSGKVKMIDGSFMLGIYQSLFAITYFVLLGSKKSILSILWAASMPFLSGERGLAICLLIIFCMYYLLLFLRKNKLIYSTFFFIICICVTVYQFVYVALYNSEIGSILNKFSSIYTDQNFFSGRQFIWAAVNNSILESPIIGYGLGNNVLISNNIFISAHNTYVEIMLNGGFISILLYFMFMYSIWMYLFKYLENNAVRLSASFLIGVIVFGVNGVIIIGNDINFSLYIWLIIGIGIMVRNAISKGVYNRNI